MISKSPDPPCNFSDPRILTRYVVPQGSITIEGISLAVASINGTRSRSPSSPTPTPLPASSGAPLDIEVDVLGKYAERQQQKQEEPIFIEQYLNANGY